MSRDLRVATAFLTALLALLTGAPAHAQPPANGPQAPEQIIQRFDRNADGKLSRTEFPRPDFNRFDVNGDGFVTVEEIKAAIAKRAGAAKSAHRTRVVPGLYFIDAHSQMDQECR